jgi:hypothetical protein
VVAYKDKDFNSDMAVVVAPTYTMALVEFMIKYPECEYMSVLEVVGNESAV